MKTLQEYKELREKVYKEWKELIDSSLEYNPNRNHYKDSYRLDKLAKMLSNIEKCIQVLEHPEQFYNEEEWITKKNYHCYTSLKDAREQFAKQLSKLNGVKVGATNGKVVGVTVTTKNKIYQYAIHAHYTNEFINNDINNVKVGYMACLHYEDSYIR